MTDCRPAATCRRRVPAPPRRADRWRRCPVRCRRGSRRRGRSADSCTGGAACWRRPCSGGPSSRTPAWRRWPVHGAAHRRNGIGRAGMPVGEVAAPETRRRRARRCRGGRRASCRRSRHGEKRRAAPVRMASLPALIRSQSSARARPPTIGRARRSRCAGSPRDAWQVVGHQGGQADAEVHVGPVRYCAPRARPAGFLPLGPCASPPQVLVATPAGTTAGTHGRSAAGGAPSRSTTRLTKMPGVTTVRDPVRPARTRA